MNIDNNRLLNNIEKMLSEIEIDLADNYYDSDRNVLKRLLEETIANAFFISNRQKTEDNLNILSFEIKNCVKGLYLQRGTEDVNSLSESGRNSSFKSPIDEMRDAIVRNGKRVY